MTGNNRSEGSSTPLIPQALETVLAAKSCDPFTGLPYPLESTRLIIKVGNKLALSWTANHNWSLVGGISKSIAPGDTHFTDFRAPIDPRYLDGSGQQQSPTKQQEVTVESPLHGLMRETEEELTSDHRMYLQKEPANDALSDEDSLPRTPSVSEHATEVTPENPTGTGALAWLLDRIRYGRWAVVVATKSRGTVTNYKTYVCLCAIELTQTELSALNATIAQYPHREHLRFEIFPYTLNAKNEFEFAFPAHQRMRRYDEKIIFGEYGPTVLQLITD